MHQPHSAFIDYYEILVKTDTFICDKSILVITTLIRSQGTTNLVAFSVVVLHKLCMHSSLNKKDNRPIKKEKSYYLVHCITLTKSSILKKPAKTLMNLSIKFICEHL